MSIDPYLDALKEAAQFLDTQLSKIDRYANRSEDPDMTGEWESSEYVSGLGFVACQQYMACTFAGRVSKRTALGLGPEHRCGTTFAVLVDAAANYWKHCTEWDEPNADLNRAKQTLQPLKRLGVNTDQSYVLVNVLHEMLRPHPPRFQPLVPFLERWCEDVRSKHLTGG